MQYHNLFNRDIFVRLNLVENRDRQSKLQEKKQKLR